MFLKKLQNWQDFFLSVLRNFFYRTLPDDCFWWIGLMVKNFNSVSLIYLNSQLYHALPRVMTIILVEQRTLFNEKTWLNSKSQTLFWHYFRGSLAEVLKVVFMIFSKPTGKYLCKSLCVGISESLCHFWESCPPSNFYFGFFYKLFQAAALQQKDPSKGFCKFWELFEISYRTRKRQMLLFLLDLYEILPLPSKHFSYYTETVALAQPYKNK